MGLIRLRPRLSASANVLLARLRVLKESDLEEVQCRPEKNKKKLLMKPERATFDPKFRGKTIIG